MTDVNGRARHHTGRLRPLRQVLAEASTAIGALNGPSRRGFATASQTELPIPPCPTCGGAGFLRLDRPAGHPEFGTVVKCQCREARQRDEYLTTLHAMSGLRPAMARMTFDAYRAELPDLSAALSAARQFAATPTGWLYLYGSYGCGKTHLLTAIALSLIQRRVAALYVVVPTLLDQLRAAAAGRDEGFWDVWQRIQRAEVLLLDDLGAERSTEYAVEKLYLLVNDRYQGRLPLVVASNLAPAEIGGRIGSRLGDVRLTTLVSIGAPDYRTHAQEEAR